jgi:hypothetical protein
MTDDNFKFCLPDADCHVYTCHAAVKIGPGTTMLLLRPAVPLHENEHLMGVVADARAPMVAGIKYEVILRPLLDQTPD